MIPKTIVATAAMAAAGCVVLAARTSLLHVGPQRDGSFIVSTGARIGPGTIAFDGRPFDIALHPSGAFFAVLNEKSVFLADRGGVLPGSIATLPANASFRGVLWNPDGSRLFVSLANGSVQELRLQGRQLALDREVAIGSPSEKRNPAPGGMAITRDGRRLFVAEASRNAVGEIDAEAGRWMRDWPVQNIPFEVKLSPDESRLIVSNWGGRFVQDGDDEGPSGGGRIVVDPRGVAASGTVSIVPLDGGATHQIAVGLHPTGIAVSGNRAYIANAGSDSISEIDLSSGIVSRTIPIRWGAHPLFGSMPTALAIHGSKLYACDGGDNALCEIDLAAGRVVGFRPAGFFPMGVGVSADGETAYVVNSKGDGTVRETLKGQPGRTKEFRGTVSILDLTSDSAAATARTADRNGWTRSRSVLRPKLAVYRGAIRHVLYVIKENRTYDQVFGDISTGNGDPKLCEFCGDSTPNLHSLARAFTLFDNTYTCGENSADGHQWTDEALANDYIERFFGHPIRSYPFDGADAMAIANSGCIWDAATHAGKTFRDFGEFCATSLARFTPRPTSWLEMWKDRQEKTNRFTVRAGTTVNGLKPYIDPEVIDWPLLASDQWRADRFIEEYRRFSQAGRVPNLMILALPCDHTEGSNPGSPRPRSMAADNDLALGRVVEAISHSPEWKSTCIFSIEDDSQSGLDHVDGHRTECLAISPYVRRRFVDSTLYTQISLVRSIELMLDIPPMNRLDATAAPFAACFTDHPDATPVTASPNRIPLDDLNPPLSALKPTDRFWARKSLGLDWSGLDRPDPYWLDRVIWRSVHAEDVPYPGRREIG